MGALSIDKVGLLHFSDPGIPTSTSDLPSIDIPEEVSLGEAKIYPRGIDGDHFEIKPFRGDSLVTFYGDPRTYIGDQATLEVEPEQRFDLKEVLLGLSTLQILTVPDLPQPINGAFIEEKLYVCWVKDRDGNFTLFVFDNSQLSSKAWFKYFSEKFGDGLAILYAGNPNALDSVDPTSESFLAKVSGRIQKRGLDKENRKKGLPTLRPSDITLGDQAETQNHYARILKYLYPNDSSKVALKTSEKERGIDVEHLLTLSGPVVSQEGGAYLVKESKSGRVYYFDHQGDKMQSREVPQEAIRIRKTSKGIYVFMDRTKKGQVIRLRLGAGGGKEKVWNFGMPMYDITEDLSGTEVALASTFDGFYAKVLAGLNPLSGYYANKLGNFKYDLGDYSLMYVGGRTFVYLQPSEYRRPQYSNFTLNKGEDSSDNIWHSALGNIQFSEGDRIFKTGYYKDAVFIDVGIGTSYRSKKTNRGLNIYTLFEGLKTNDSRLELRESLLIPDSWVDFDFVIDGDELIYTYADNQGDLRFGSVSLQILLENKPVEKASSIGMRSFGDYKNHAISINDSLVSQPLTNASSFQSVNLTLLGEKTYLLQAGKDLYRIKR